MKVLRGLTSKAAAGRYFPLSYPEVKKALDLHATDSLPSELTVELRNTTGPTEHGHLLLEYERGFSLIVFSVPDEVPASSASMTTRSALRDIFRLPALETSSRLKGCRRLYRAYSGDFCVPVLTEVFRTYAVGKYRGSESLATASKVKLTGESERRVSVLASPNDSSSLPTPLRGLA